MVGLGLLMILTGIWGFWLRLRGRLFENRTFLHLVVWMGPSGVLAILAGWFTTEIGRQPWVVYGLMRTADASSGHSAEQVGLTLALFVVVYFALFGAGISYVMRLVRRGPVTDEGKQEGAGGPGRQRTPARPISAADESFEAGESDELGERN